MSGDKTLSQRYADARRTAEANRKMAAMMRAFGPIPNNVDFAAQAEEADRNARYYGERVRGLRIPLRVVQGGVA
ncbi:hypothetical protein AA103196_0994 [Ameyamaea chiangmaiensis NBRC 103196]|uniref:Uncharacterized protein n=1 Tax=Ameyamaea chiangmaiensis TaxID=442969 RepID=A0A850PAM1_9PROT|nr:hypothetical protein [Ameyamaea chiangmaiensis]MBS4074620.1 hypothetical protein [Ameyamaea chiangmaiensis]NVN39376.1 hypothetical protein [Ameyamaea chiangmaiensis]GBQ64873.1 hypothetical protein AA103196_0994 [Ameyamaea chiangmaiensis NBRC 103196]